MEQTKQRGLNAAALKWIALLSMLLDHIGYALVWHGWIVPAGLWQGPVKALYVALRVVGRPAFPIFCFLLAEGFRHTHSRARYLLRLAIFALLSEIPFDLALRDRWLEFGYQNVFFTLALGLAAIWAWEALTRPAPRSPARLLAAALCAGGAMAAAWLLKTDYGALGVLLILVFALLRDRPLLCALAAALTLCALVWLGNSWWIEVFAILALPLLFLYDGERGRQARFFFYAFYPGHLLFLFLIRRLLLAG